MNTDNSKILELNLLAKAKDKYPKQESRALAKARFLLQIIQLNSADFNEDVFLNDLEEQMKRSQIHR